MKKLIIATMMLCASTARAADWSPVFKEWVDDCQSFEHPVAKAVYRTSSDMVKLDEYGPLHTVLSQEGRMGNYSTVPMPYRQDLLPAVRLDRYYRRDGSQDFSDWSAGVYIPLQNAKFYNLPLQGIAFNYWEVAWYYALNFGKYSKAKERQLMKIVKQLDKTKYNADYNTVWIVRTEQDELILGCEMT